MNRFLAVALSILAAVVWPRAARADGLLTIPTVYSYYESLDLDGRPLDHRDVYRLLHYRGGATAVGGGLSVAIHYAHFRGGLDFAGFGLGGAELADGAAAPDLALTFRTPYGLRYAAFFGTTFDKGLVHPYADLRVGGTLLHWTIDRDAPGRDLDKLSGNGISLALGPRIGALVDLPGPFTLDLCGSMSLVGLRGAGLSIGFGGNFGL